MLGDDQATGVSHVAHQVGAIIISDLTELCIIVITGVCTATDNKHLWLPISYLLGEEFIVEESCLWVNGVRLRLEVDGA